MKRYPKAAARAHFSYLKYSVKNRTRNVETTKIVNILKTAGDIAKSSKIQFFVLHLAFLQGMIIGSKLYREENFFVLN